MNVNLICLHPQPEIHGGHMISYSQLDLNKLLGQKGYGNAIEVDRNEIHVSTTNYYLITIYEQTGHRYQIDDQTIM